MHGECSFVAFKGWRRHSAQNGDRCAQQFTHECLVLVLHEEFFPLVVGDQAGPVSVVDVTVMNAQHHRQYFLGDQVAGQMDRVLRTGPDAFQQHWAYDDDLKARRSDPLFRFRCYRLFDRDVTYSESEMSSIEILNSEVATWR